MSTHLVRQVAGVAVSVVALSVLGPTDASGEGQRDNDLAMARSFRCDFTDGTSRDVNPSGLGPLKVTDPGLSDIVFSDVSSEKGTATMVGNLGSDSVAVVAGSEALSFVATTQTGTVVVTTLPASTHHPVKSGPLTLTAYRAVMSRHVALTRGGAIISTFYGICRALVN
jgi:hypothetical protein